MKQRIHHLLRLAALALAALTANAQETNPPAANNSPARIASMNQCLHYLLDL